jgi:prepilin-type N-terminal cleavage/methylation domain-containing protein
VYNIKYQKAVFLLIILFLMKNLSKNFKSGFTLIELLVVVAIIGILASVVLASLNTARGKGADAAVKANLANIRAQAELLYDMWGNYAVDATPTHFNLAQCANTADTLFSNATIWNQIKAAYEAGAGVAGTRCVATSGAYAVAVQLKTSDGNTLPGPDSWCVDSAGSSKAYAWTTGQTITNSINGTVCK